jgi:hypothetical protein
MCLLNWKFSGNFSQSDLQEGEEAAGLVPSCSDGAGLVPSCSEGVGLVASGSDALIGQNFRKPCYITCIFLPPNCQNPYGADCHPQDGGNSLLLNMATQSYYVVCKPRAYHCGVLCCNG